MLPNFLKHKTIIGLILVAILFGGYFTYKIFFKKSTKIRYILAKVERGKITVSVSGSGQISSLDQIDVKPKVSGEVEEIFVKEDQKINKGDLLLKLKTKDFEIAINNAKIALENAKIQLNNLKKNKENTQKDLNNYYKDAFNLISATLNEMAQHIQTLKPIFTESSYGGDQADIDYYRSVTGLYNNQSFPKDEKEIAFNKLNEKYQKILQDYLSLSSFSQPEILEEWLEKTSNLTKEASDLSRSGRDIISFYKETISKQGLTPPIPLSITENQLTQLISITNSLDQKFSNLFSLSKTIDQLKYSISNYDDNISSQEKVLKQTEDNLEKAKENYENCFIRAPFEGKIAKIHIENGDYVNLNTPLITLISTQKIAEISLNEIEAAKVKIEQKAILSFDALPDLKITGKIFEIDTVGTISQGVVSYGIKIILDSDDERIKPGMSVTAEIVVDSKSDILLLPNSAVKSQGDVYYVELVKIPEGKEKEFLNKRGVTSLPVPPKRREVKIGISNDNFTEILSGLEEGDIVISSIIFPQTPQTQRTQQFQIPGFGAPQMRSPR